MNKHSGKQTKNGALHFSDIFQENTIWVLDVMTKFLMSRGL
jgi:hypothetical protein